MMTDAVLAAIRIYTAGRRPAVMTDGVPMDQAQYDRICDAWRRLEADAGAEPAPIDWLAINREFAA